MTSPVGAMFGRIAGVYDLLNHLLSLGVDKYWRKELAKLATQSQPHFTLDLAAGTLDVALAINRRSSATIIPALDFCPQMLEAGLRKLKTPELKSHILPCAADALHIPIKTNFVDSVTMAFGIRNIEERMAAFQEMLRVLKPGGIACILEFGSGQERIWGGLYNFYLARILPIIGKFIARDNKAYAYLARTIREFPDAGKLAREMTEAGFNEVGWRKLTSGIVCLHWGLKPVADYPA